MKTEIIYEDKELIVCYKPAGFATQTAQIASTDCVNEVKNYLAQKADIKTPYLALINRIDQPVEGLVLFAKTELAAQKLSKFIMSGEMEKYYYAIVEGVVDSKEAELVNYLLKDKKTNLSKVVQKGTPEAKRAELSYEVCKMDENTFLKIHLKTGRHHQIRVQLSHMGHPIVGDSKYGAKKIKGTIALSAYRIVVKHPQTGQTMAFEVLPKDEKFQTYIG